MGRLIVFTQISLDGYFTDSHGDMSWAHAHEPDAEWASFVEGNAKGGGMLLFGRVTYDMMLSYWPTRAAAERSPVVAERMNAMPKLVFSRTLDEASWKNTTLAKGDVAATVRRLKKESNLGMAIMGSGTIVAQLALEGLVDEYQMVVNPIVLGGGRTVFDGLHEKLRLKLTKTRSFANGNVLLCHEPRG